MPWDWDGLFVRPTVRVVTALAAERDMPIHDGPAPPEPPSVVPRRTAWERVLTDDFIPEPKRRWWRRAEPIPGVKKIIPESRWERFTRWWHGSNRVDPE